MSTDRTIAFVDLAGFTALTEAHGDQVAVDLIETFTRISTGAIDGTGTDLDKTIGDADMLASATPDGAIIAVQRLFEAAYDLGGFPEPRAGLHHGSVVARGDDFFGATVNLAARVASRAGSGQALGTSPILDAVHGAGIDTVSFGLHQLRNIVEPVELWALELCPTHIDLSVDPVCRMRLECQAAVGRVRHNGVEYRLCSLGCTATFAADPDRYLDAGTR